MTQSLGGVPKGQPSSAFAVKISSHSGYLRQDTVPETGLGSIILRRSFLFSKTLHFEIISNLHKKLQKLRKATPLYLHYISQLSPFYQFCFVIFYLKDHMRVNCRQDASLPNSSVPIS